MAISTNSVIHYTDSIEHLKSIIENNGFRFKYCLEQIQMHDELETPSAAFPMICFCDIPLSEVKNHIDTYGSYGIGLTKNWAKLNGLNPVLYIDRKSKLTKVLHGQAMRIIDQIKAGKVDVDSFNDFFHFLSYCKNYEGRIVKGKVNTDSYRFYNEREWRLVASSSDLGESDFLDGEKYLTDKNGYNEKIKNCFSKFSYTDITYIIVDSEEEIPEILKILNDKFESIATAKDLKILSTKVLTKNQIWNDF